MNAPHPLAVAGIQTDIHWEDPAATLAHVAPAISRAAAAGARLCVLPEMFATGFSMRAGALGVHHDAIAAACAELARSHGVWLLAGLVEPVGADAPAGSRPRNAAVVWSPDGSEALRYHKIHPFTFGGEHEHYDGGTALPTLTIEGVRVTVLVCYDLRFVELFRARADATDLFCVIANWPEARWEHWATLLRARAIETQAYVLGVNRVGEGGGLRYRGDSALYGPFGEPLATASSGETLVLGAVDPQQVALVREKTSFLRDRRPEVYAAWRR
ncbi:MAG: carbon-nitrogen family hydrolase [Deltaproteobacteria bacterium]|nr:carbon-nitrogen family hydrolase [Deltaproteobacteria bacterium]